MPLNAAALDAVKTSIDGRFNDRIAELHKNEPWTSELVDPITMTKPIVDFGWLGYPGAVREWKDTRSTRKLRADHYLIATREWENSIQIKGTDLRDYGIEPYNKRIDALAESFVAHGEKLIVEALLAGFITTSDFGACFDNTAFFNHVHPLADGGTSTYNDNLMHHTLDDAGALDDAVLLMRSLKCDDLSPANVVPDQATLLVGPALEATARALVMDQYLTGGASNPNYGRFKLRVSNYIVSGLVGGSTGTTTGNEWFVIDQSGSCKPVFKATLEDVWTDMVGVGSDDHFATRTHKYGGGASYNVAYAFYQKVIGSDGTV